MNGPGFNNLLKWSIENSAASRNDPSAPAPATIPDPNALGQLMGMMPASDAEVMDADIKVIKNTETPLEARREAFKELQMLVEGIDNANNLEPLGLWGDLVEQLGNEDPELRMWAAWTIGTAIANNPRGQQRLLIMGAIPTLVKISTEDEFKDARLRAITALSSVSRNFQPGLDAVLDNLPAQFKPKQKIDTNDMESVNILTDSMRAEAKKMQ